MKKSEETTTTLQPDAKVTIIKQAAIKNNLHGLTAYLDEYGFIWEYGENDSILITYTTLDELFKIGFEFGRFYELD